jgi:HPt (histidine-containing phosphotransfer) domain-containing protein
MGMDYNAYVDKDLADLVPGFLENRRRDVTAMIAALQKQDWDTIHRIGHQIKGSGGGYGFDMISAYGRMIQESSEAQDYAACEGWLYGLLDYLDKVQITYQ